MTKPEPKLVPKRDKEDIETLIMKKEKIGFCS